MQSNLALELVRVTEAAALAAARTMGLGDADRTHQAAVQSMHHTLSQMPVSAVVALGEGQVGEVQALAHGSEIGAGGPGIELLLLPIDGPTSCAQGGGYALSLVAASEAGVFLRTPDIDYEKIAVGPKGKGVIDLRLSPVENLKRLAEAMKSYVEDLTIAILDRPRHTDLIRSVRDAGARIRLIPGGDTSGALATVHPMHGIDALMGVGKAREGLLAAAALYAVGGDLQMRPRPQNRVEQEALAKVGIHDFNKIFKLNDLVSGEVFFAATGVTRSEFLEGVHFKPGGAVSHSFVVRSGSATVRRIVSDHFFDREPKY